MADHKVSSERKKELEKLDPFQENLLKAAALLKAYKRQLILIAGAIVLVAAVFSGIMYSFKTAENKAAGLVSQALNTYAKANDPDKGYLETQGDFETVFTEYANTIAGKQARLKFAKICYDAAKFDQSYALYKESLEVFKKDALMVNFIRASLGHVCLARQEFDEAKKYFLQIEEGKTNLLRDEAGYALAMLYEAQNEPDLGKKMYERIVTEHENSMYLPIAKSKIDEM